MKEHQNKINEAMDLLKKVIAEKEDAFTLGRTEVLVELDSVPSYAEKVKKLRAYLKTLYEQKIEIDRVIQEEWTPEQRVNSFSPVQLGHNALIGHCEDLLTTYNKIAELETNVEEEKTDPLGKTEIQKLTTKQQVLLLHTLGLLELPFVKEMSTVNKALLFSSLINRSEKNVKDLITYIDGKNPPKEFACYTADNVSAVNSVLKKIGLAEIQDSERRDESL